MTSKQDAKYSMYLAIKSVCDRYASVYEDHEAFTDLYDKWAARVANIKSLGQVKASRNTGVAQDKRRLRVEMCDAGAGNRFGYACLRGGLQKPRAGGARGFLPQRSALGPRCG